MSESKYKVGDIFQSKHSDRFLVVVVNISNNHLSEVGGVILTLIDEDGSLLCLHECYVLGGIYQGQHFTGLYERYNA